MTDYWTAYTSSSHESDNKTLLWYAGLSPSTVRPLQPAVVARLIPGRIVPGGDIVPSLQVLVLMHLLDREPTSEHIAVETLYNDLAGMPIADERLVVEALRRLGWCGYAQRRYVCALPEPFGPTSPGPTWPPPECMDALDAFPHFVDDSDRRWPRGCITLLTGPHDNSAIFAAIELIDRAPVRWARGLLFRFHRQDALLRSARSAQTVHSLFAHRYRNARRVSERTCHCDNRIRCDTASSSFVGHRYIQLLSWSSQLAR